MRLKVAAHPPAARYPRGATARASPALPPDETRAAADASNARRARPPGAPGRSTRQRSRHPEYPRTVFAEAPGYARAEEAGGIPIPGRAAATKAHAPAGVCRQIRAPPAPELRAQASAKSPANSAENPRQSPLRTWIRPKYGRLRPANPRPAPPGLIPLNPV